jgi:hypothetical protein
MKANITAKLAKLSQRVLATALPGRSLEIFFCSLLFHRQSQLSANPDTTLYNSHGIKTDKDLIRRIVCAYQKANKADLGNSMWKAFFTAYQQPIHQTLINGDVEATAALFRNPTASDLFYGIDMLTKSYQNYFSRTTVREAYAKLCLDGLVRLAEAIGAIPIDNPETWPARSGSLWEAESVLTDLNKSHGLFSVPDPFPSEHGLKTSRGIISYRVPQSIYQAWRIKQLVTGISKPSVLEIGAGLGRTAYYAYERGIKDYTIVDIPITAAAQAYFLGRTIGEENIHLDGEQPNEFSHKVKILTPQTFFDEHKKYDLILNVDSLTEMDFSVAHTYWKKIEASTSKFLSINHEANAFRVRDLLVEDLCNLDIHREPYWMRRGYIEEVIQIHGASPDV